eukprot:748192-Rhodomonas_salina.2
MSAQEICTLSQKHIAAPCTHRTSAAAKRRSIIAAVSCSIIDKARHPCPRPFKPRHSTSEAAKRIGLET